MVRQCFSQTFLVFFLFVLILSLLSINVESKNQKLRGSARLGDSKVFDVLKYGAVADGKTDNTQAFYKTWRAACTSYIGKTAFLIPNGKFLLGPIILEGPCGGPLRFVIQGTLVARTDRASSDNVDHWITFRYLFNLVVEGGGTLDGSGASAWSFNNCRRDTKCKDLPTSLRFDFVDNSRIRRITSVNSKNSHILIFACKEFKAIDLTLTAPADSPNTDGIKIGDSTNVLIANSHIATGDDCVAIGAGSQGVNITNLRCGPGHGISIGSLGRGPNEDVKDVLVKDCTLTDTDNGVRIKTWAENSVPTSVYNIAFENINVNNVRNPILIDQQYCPSGRCDKGSDSKVKIKKVKFSNVWGTSSTPVAVNLQCSKSHPCEQVELNDIKIAYHGADKSRKSQTSSACDNVYGRSYGTQVPTSCLS